PRPSRRGGHGGRGTEEVTRGSKEDHMEDAGRGVAEQERLRQAREEGVPWRKWGPYLSERQWGTRREGYSGCGCASPSPSGTGGTRSSRSGCSGSPTRRATTARM